MPSRSSRRRRPHGREGDVLDRTVARTSLPDSATVADWDLRTLGSDALSAALADVAAFVDRLVDDGIEVPRCWYAHGWIRERLAALLHWRTECYAASARSAADWWAMGIGLLVRDWEPVI